MSKNFDVLAIGETLLRLSPLGGDRLVRGDQFAKQVGGAELNVMTGVSLLGLHSGMISKLPDNDIGIFVKNRIRFSGVSDDYLVYDREKDARMGIYYYESAAYPRKPRVVYDRAHTSFNKISLDDYDDSIYSAARCFHTSGITLAISENARKTAIGMMKRFKEAGAVISFDVNFRGNLWTGEEARKCIEEILPLVDIFFCSESTAQLTFAKTGSLEDIMKSFTTEYPISVVASTQRTVHSPKVHDFGSVIYSSKNDRFYTEEPYKGIEVVDRIGSGDAYVGGVLYGLLSDPEDYLRALEFGDAASAVKNTIPGDLPSSDRNELEEVIKAHKSTGSQTEMSR
jgi:2-dehydro-3-deoxygluconokinase